uniref:Uncharacterized protein n=1 Tax=Rhipicephalus microplus TaxID=6941 RepID=A0A6G5AGT1_RHIMP
MASLPPQTLYHYIERAKPRSSQVGWITRVLVKSSQIFCYRTFEERPHGLPSRMFWSQEKNISSPSGPPCTGPHGPACPILLLRPPPLPIPGKPQYPSRPGPKLGPIGSMFPTGPTWPCGMPVFRPLVTRLSMRTPVERSTVCPKPYIGSGIHNRRPP